MAKRIKRVTKVRVRRDPAVNEVVRETVQIKKPIKTVVRTPATLAEAVGDPLMVIPEKPAKTKVVRRVVRKTRAA
jgi:hypothetical protein